MFYLFHIFKAGKKLYRLCEEEKKKTNLSFFKNLKNVSVSHYFLLLLLFQIIIIIDLPSGYEKSRFYSKGIIDKGRVFYLIENKFISCCPHLFRL